MRNWVLTTGLPFDPVTDNEAEIKQALASLRATAGKGATRGGERGGYYATISAELTPAKYPEVEAQLLDYASRHRMADEARQIVYAELDRLAEVNPDAVGQIRKSVRQRVREATGIPDWDISEEAVRARIDQLGAAPANSSAPPDNPVDVYARFINDESDCMKGYELKLRPLLTTMGASDLYGFLELRGAGDPRTASDDELIRQFKACQTTQTSESEERKAAEKDLASIGLEILERGLRSEYDAFLEKRSIEKILAELDLLPAGMTVPEGVARRQASDLTSYVANAEDAALLLLGCMQTKGLVCPMSYEDLYKAAGGVVSDTTKPPAPEPVGAAASSAGAVQGEAKKQSPSSTGYASADDVIRRAQEQVRAQKDNATAQQASDNAAPQADNGSVGQTSAAAASADNPWKSSDYSVPLPKRKQGKARKIAGIVAAAVILSGVIASVAGVFGIGSSPKNEPKVEQPVVASVEYNENYSGTLYPAVDPNNGLYGYLGADGKWAIKPEFKTASFFEDGLAMQKDDLSGLYGYINEKGAWAIEPQFVYAEWFSDGYALVQAEEDGSFFYIDTAGKKALTNLRGDLMPITGFHDGYAWAIVLDDSEEDYKLCIVDKSGKAVGELKVPAKNGYLPGLFHEGLSAWADSDGYVCFVDTTGAVKIRGKYSAASAFGNGYAAVQSAENGKWGYIDKNGKTVVSAQFDEASNFREGYAVVKSKGSYYFIDTNFNAVEHPFSSCNLFLDGLSCCVDADSFGLFNTSGKLVVDLDGIAKQCSTGVAEHYIPSDNKV